MRFPEHTGASLTRLWQLQPAGPEAPGVVYAGTEPAALFRSTDHGTTFELVEPLWAHPHRATPAEGGLRTLSPHRAIAATRHRQEHAVITETPTPVAAPTAPFGSVFAPTMSVASFDGTAWSPAEVVALETFRLHPGTHALHYGSSCFEGLRTSRAWPSRRGCLLVGSDVLLSSDAARGLLRGG